jgi:hypothetical protein
MKKERPQSERAAELAVQVAGASRILLLYATSPQGISLLPDLHISWENSQL